MYTVLARRQLLYSTNSLSLHYSSSVLGWKNFVLSTGPHLMGSLTDLSVVPVI